MNFNDFSTLLINKFSFNPTDDQKKAIISISQFLISDKNTSLFILKGYAGTGKSTSIGHLVRFLPKINKRAVLMAPTGRAAKVMGAYAGKKAFTIHKQIYYTKSEGGSAMQFTLTLKSDISRAKDFENPSTPAFDATYTDSPLRPIGTAMVEKFTIEPLLFLIRKGANNWQQ